MFLSLRFSENSENSEVGAPHLLVLGVLFVGLAIVVVGGCCWLVGFLCAAILFSAQCRRLISFAARAISVSLQQVAPVVASSDFRGRLAEYHRGS